MPMTPIASKPAHVTKKPLSVPPALAVRAVLALRKALLRAADAVVPPQLAVFDLVAGAARTHMIAELARLRVADLVEAEPLDAAAIAKKTGTNADAMARTMRAALAMGLFTRDAQGRYVNNRLSAPLRSGDVESVRSLAEYFGGGSNMRAWCEFPETLRTGASGFERVHRKPVWDWFDEHPDERENFAHAMMTMTLVDAPGIAATYPFDEVARLCDVGGGRGTLLSEILLHHPHLRAVLCDARGVLDSAEEFLKQRGVRDRVELVPGSFFDAVPKGCDAYVLKNVLHDWDDERCVSILENCRAAMRPGDKVLVVEALVEEETDDFGALADMQMMIVCSDGRERGRAEYERLLEKAGFRLARVLEAPTPIAIIEGVAV
ncbi:MAG: hypothetical protein KF819_00665 [Labilithrix sp.]|nr:hypothetical protein [Labilithrix sp.]